MGPRIRLHGGRISTRGQRREGWVPAPRLHGGRISTRGQRGEGLRDSWAPLRCGRNDMWVVGRGSRPRFHGGQALRGNDGGRDGSPHPRGQRGEGGGFPSPFARVVGASREQWREGWVPAPRFHGGRISTRGQGGEGLRDSWVPLRCARYDMWVVGMGPRPPSSRGQDLDARTMRERAARFLGSDALRLE